MKQIARTPALFLALLAASVMLAPIAALGDEQSPEGIEFQDEIEIGDSGKIAEKTVACDTERTCWGTAPELFSRVLIRNTEDRWILLSATVKQRLAAFGCGETWSLWHHDSAQRDRILNQVTVAEALDKTIWLIFRKDPVAEHCDIDYVYRGIGHNP